MDSMQDAGKYDWAFGLGFMYSYVLTVPHSVAVNLAFPKQIALQGTIPDCKGGMHALAAMHFAAGLSASFCSVVAAACKDSLSQCCGVTMQAGLSKYCRRSNMPLTSDNKNSSKQNMWPPALDEEVKLAPVRPHGDAFLAPRKTP